MPDHLSRTSRPDASSGPTLAGFAARLQPPRGGASFVRTLAIVNPVAGRSDAGEVVGRLDEIFGQQPCWLIIYQTTGKEPLVATIGKLIERHRPDLVVVAGGDGTVQAVVDAIASTAESVEQRPLLAILPLGTVNLLARELGVPTDLEQALALLHALLNARGHARRIDLIRVGQQHFACRVAYGDYAKVSAGTSAKGKRFVKRFAYVWQALDALTHPRVRRFELEIDGRIEWLRASSLILTNVGATGSGELRWGPSIRCDDGQIEVCAIHAEHASEWLSTIWHGLRGRVREAPPVTMLHARGPLRVRCHERVVVRGDGEEVCAPQARIDVLAGAISVLVPESASGEDQNTALSPSAGST